MRDFGLQASLTPEEERLDDAAFLRAADASGALLAAASAGGQIRAVATAVADGAVDRLRGARPRALVWVVGRNAQARQAADLVAALAAEQRRIPGVPVVPVDQLPGWVGALDVICVSGSDAGDPAVAEAIALARHRGCEIVCDLPAEGPVAEAAGSAACWLPALSFVSPVHAMLRHTAAGLAVLSALGLPEVDLAHLADSTDATLEALRPDLATAVNPAKLLARDIAAAAQPIVVYEDAVAGALARRLAQAFTEAGSPLGAAPLADALRFGPQLTARAAARGAPAADDIFHDDFIDGPRPSTGPSYFGLVAAAPPGRVHRLAAPLGNVNWIALTGATADDETSPQFADLLVGAVAGCAGGEMAAAYGLVAG